MPTNRNNMPTTFAEIDAALGNRKQITLCHNTVAFRDNDTIDIALHGKVIVTLHPNNHVGVRHCGYVTTTTFDRIKRFLPSGYSVTRQGGVPRILHVDGGCLFVNAGTFTFVA